MRNETLDMAFTLPNCRYCGKKWLPQDAVVASQTYCTDCSPERRVVATKTLGTSFIDRSRGLGAYVLPNRTKAS